jgi:hypothetical protein
MAWKQTVYPPLTPEQVRLRVAAGQYIFSSGPHVVTEQVADEDEPESDEPIIAGGE